MSNTVDVTTCPYIHIWTGCYMDSIYVYIYTMQLETYRKKADRKQMND